MSEYKTATHRQRDDEHDNRAAHDRVTRDRALEWSSDRIVDPGDSHDKGEPSLCVGEAA